MSFKRQGNDTGLLAVIQKRRIKDLLAEDIPEDEAKLLSNGRFACLVCSRRPIFDTVNMLSLHRNGNKHKTSAEIHDQKKEELRLLIAKRKHEQFMSTGSAVINVATPYHAGISTSSPYDSRVKKSKLKPGGRKLRVDFHHDCKDSKAPVCSTSADAKTNCHQSTPLWQRVCEQQQHGPMKHDSRLKNISREEEPVRLDPYTSRRHVPYSRLSESTKDSCSTSHKNRRLGIGVLNCDISKCDLNLPRVKSNIDFSPGLSNQLSTSTSSKPQFACCQPPPPPPPTVSSTSTHCVAASTSVSSNLEESPQSETQKSLAVKYHQLQGSGWKRDWDGKWVKDDQAEFDSDEEAPDLP